MPETRKAIVVLLDGIARNDLPLDESVAAVRSALRFDDGLIDRVYEALRDLVWKLLTGRQYGTEIRGWFDLVAHAASLVRSRQEPTVAVKASKFDALADLLGQTARFASYQPFEEVLRRKHVQTIVSSLATEIGPVPRSRLAEASELGDANLSRVLAILQSNGVVERTRSGKEAFFHLTEAVKPFIDVSAASVDRYDRVRQRLDVLPVCYAAWTFEGSHLSEWNGGFRKLVERCGLSTEPDLSYELWRSALHRTARSVRETETDGTSEIEFGEGTCFRYSERRDVEGEIVVAAENVGVYKRRERDLEDRLSKAILALKAERARVAHTEMRHDAALAGLRALGNLVANTAHGARRAVAPSRADMDLPLISFSFPAQPHGVEAALWAMENLSRNLVADPWSNRGHGTEMAVVNVRDLIQESVRTAGAMHLSIAEPTIDGLQRVRANEGIRKWMTHCVLLTAEDVQHGPVASLHMQVEGSVLIVSVTNHAHAKSKSVFFHRGPDGDEVGVDPREVYLRVAAEMIGGQAVPTNETEPHGVKYRFPVEPL